MRRYIALALLALAATGCTHIGFFGDSITDSSRSTLQTKARQAFYTSNVYASPGLKIAQVSERVAQGLEARPDTYAFVINAGTNDVGGDNLMWEVDYDALLAQVVDKPCVVLTNINTFANLIAPPALAPAEGINTYLVAQVETHSNYRLVDWNAAVKDPAHESYVSDIDGIHPSQAGKDWLAQQYVAAVQDCENTNEP